MSNLILTKGLPASGKTTWAQNYCGDDPKRFIVCRDDLRMELFGKPIGSKQQEKEVTELQEKRTSNLLRHGYDVIWADTNLRQDCFDRAHRLSVDHGANLILNDSFMWVPLTELLVRDAAREKSVGRKVLARMYEKYALPFYLLKKQLRLDDVRPLPEVPRRPKAIIVDVDGTVADRGDRSPFSWDKVHLDKPRLDIITLVNAYVDFEGVDLIFLSGRDGCCYEETDKWLSNYFEDYTLYMRPTGSMEKDSKVKSDILTEQIEPHYDVKMIFDDRQQVVDMWRMMGYQCLQVQAGLF